MPALRLVSHATAQAQAEELLQRLADEQPTVTIHYRPLPEVAGALPAPVPGHDTTADPLTTALHSGAADAVLRTATEPWPDLSSGSLLAACPARSDPRPALVLAAAHAGSWPAGEPLGALPAGARLGCGLPIVRAQLRHLRPDLQWAPLPASLEAARDILDSGSLDALVAPVGDLGTLPLEPQRIHPFLPGLCLPPPGQGGLRLEAQTDHPSVVEILAALNDDATRHALTAEQAVAGAVNEALGTTTAGDWLVGAFADVAGESLMLTVCLAMPDGEWLTRREAVGPATAAAALGTGLATALLATLPRRDE